MLQSLSSYIQNIMQEKKQREKKAECQKRVDTLQAEKDLLRLEKLKLKAQKTRQARIRINEFSASQTAEEKIALSRREWRKMLIN